jgi:energy-converting hydrogenase B subunit D
MAEFLIAIALVLVVFGALGVVTSRDPALQALSLGLYGLLLTLLFTVLQAPDVGLSQLAVGTAVTPLMVMLAVRKVRERGPGPHAQQPGGRPGAAGPGPKPGEPG